MQKTRQRQWTLRKQLTVVIFSIVMLVMLLSGILFMGASYYFSNKRLEVDADDIAVAMAKQITTAIIFEHDEYVDELLGGLTQRADITLAQVYLIKSVQNQQLNPKSKFSQGVNCKTSPLFYLTFNKCALVWDGEERIATVKLTFTRQYLLEQQITQLFILLGSLVFSLLVSLFFAAKISKKLTSPLSNLVQLMQTVAKGQLYHTHVDVSGGKEIRELSESFNQMLIELQSKDRAIVTHTSNLELLVNERTLSLQHALKSAESANASKSEFLANMSHELRTPLHCILSFAQFGLDNYRTADPEKLLKYFDCINISGKRLLVLLNALLDLASLEAGKMTLYKESRYLYAVAANCVAEQSDKLQDKQLNFTWHNKECNTIAFFDNARIGQVITSLLSNAIKFTPAGKSIELAFYEVDYLNQPAVQLTISDQGVGIPGSELDLVFDKFVQSSKTKTNAGGAGLGLAICKEIICLHGGKIWAESEPDQGARFSFILPVKNIDIDL